ncbi:MAG: Y4bD/Y4pK family protein [Clostridiales bacterium]|nr:Y4bD/Y4pK family protein [Clostridiales bacterium]
MTIFPTLYAPQKQARQVNLFSRTTRTAKKRLHNAKEILKGVKTITITHPYHPEKGEVYEYVGRIKYEYAECVKCVDKYGEIKVFPITYTNLHTYDESVIGDGCTMTVENLLSLCELIDSIRLSGDV